MLFRQLFDPVSSTYTYLLADPRSRDAILIDSVFERHQRDAALVRELDLKLCTTIDTHCHADHVTGAWLMHKNLGSQIAASDRIGASNVHVPLKDGSKVRFGDYTVIVRATPGHTDGCLTLVSTDRTLAFTGDCLLIRGAGRTDFQQGDAKTLFHSIHRQIFSLPDACLLYPGHDYEGRTVSTVAEEKRFNARVGGEANETDFVGYMENLNLPHPKLLDVAVPANMRSGEPEDGKVPAPATWGPVFMTYAGVPTVEATWVAQQRHALHLLDVRPEREFDEELPLLTGASFIPLDDLRTRVSEVPKDKPVILVCRSGRRSALAATILAKSGVPEVANLEGGIIRWRSLALPF